MLGSITLLYICILQQSTSSCPCPNAIQYRVYHNVSNSTSDTVSVVLAPTTTATITGATLSSTYNIEFYLF